MDPNFLRNVQYTLDKQTKNIKSKKMVESTRSTRSASPASTNTNTTTSSKSAEKGKIRSFFRQWCPTDVRTPTQVRLRYADPDQPSSIPGGKVDQSGGYFTYKLKEEPKVGPPKLQRKHCARQPHLEALVEE
jgi:hypothetical protein